ncbi:enoyl-CoA hydratase [Erythrobacter sp. F6033]|nr:enoyl-CoA hydratase [Erythrobacter sp. F6033]MCK0127823.1 enoyl-CoA hydratase [Erythrobacter sp. F6033]
MLNSDTTSRLFAAAFSVILSTGVFAYAIIPGSPVIA